MSRKKKKKNNLGTNWATWFLLHSEDLEVQNDGTRSSACLLSVLLSEWSKMANCVYIQQRPGKNSQFHKLSGPLVSQGLISLLVAPLSPQNHIHGMPQNGGRRTPRFVAQADERVWFQRVNWGTRVNNCVQQIKEAIVRNQAGKQKTNKIRS